MATPVIAIFSGNNATSGAVAVNGPGGGGSLVPGVLQGDKILEVLNIANGTDLTSDFALIVPANGIIVQIAGSLGGLTLLALLTRGG